MRVALIGNQNSGKTTLFNSLTGANQKIGNWPGVTIEKKEGVIRGTRHVLVDLPGVYSLSPYTAEEEVSRKYAVEEKPDVVVNIVDATSLERSLYLTTQLLELDVRVIVALNMCDMLEKKGLIVDAQKLSQELGVPVVKLSALKGTGIKELISCIDSKNAEARNRIKTYHEKTEKAVAEIESKLSVENRRFIAVKVLERDRMFSEYINRESEEVTKALEREYGYDAEQIFAGQRYDYIVSVKDRCVSKRSVRESITDKLDKVFLNRWLALPIFAVIMFGIYYLAVGVVGTATVDWVGGLVESFGGWFGGVLERANASPWAVSLVCDGIVAGVGAVLNFIPQLIILFLCICLLETFGYMSRIAFLLDKIFRKFGLSGKSLIPFIVGSGCSVPAILSTRTIEDEQEKRMTIMLTPFIPCSAKLPIIALFAGFFFGGYSGLVSASLYFFAIAVIVVSALVMKRFFFKGEQTAFISELPEYKVPSPKYVLRDVGEKIFAFIRRAGTIILLCSVVIWTLSKLSFTQGYTDHIESSILAGIGNGLAWIFYPMLGEWSWGATVSAIQGLVAKEQVVSGMSIIAGLAAEAEEGALIFGNHIFGFFNPASAYAFMVFNLFSAPCFGAIGAMRRELGSTKRMWQAILFQTGIAWALGCLVFGVGSLILMI